MIRLQHQHHHHHHHHHHHQTRISDRDRERERDLFPDLLHLLSFLQLGGVFLNLLESHVCAQPHQEPQAWTHTHTHTVSPCSAAGLVVSCVRKRSITLHVVGELAVDVSVGLQSSLVVPCGGRRDSEPSEPAQVQDN